MKTHRFLKIAACTLAVLLIIGALLVFYAQNDDFGGELSIPMVSTGTNTEEQVILLITTDEGEKLPPGNGARFANLKSVLDPNSPLNNLLRTVKSFRMAGYEVISENLPLPQSARYQCSITVMAEKESSGKPSMRASVGCSVKQVCALGDIGRMSVLVALPDDNIFPAFPSDINSTVSNDLRQLRTLNSSWKCPAEDPPQEKI